MVHHVRTDGITTSSLSNSGHPSEHAYRTMMTRPSQDASLSRCNRTDQPSEEVGRREEDLPHYFHHDSEDHPCIARGISRLTCVSDQSRTLTPGRRWAAFHEAGQELGRIADELERKVCRLHRMEEAGREMQKMADEFWIELHPQLDSLSDVDDTVRKRKKS